MIRQSINHPEHPISSLHTSCFRDGLVAPSQQNHRETPPTEVKPSFRTFIDCDSGAIPPPGGTWCAPAPANPCLLLPLLLCWGVAPLLAGNWPAWLPFVAIPGCCCQRCGTPPGAPPPEEGGEVLQFGSAIPARSKRRMTRVLLRCAMISPRTDGRRAEEFRRYTMELPQEIEKEKAAESRQGEENRERGQTRHTLGIPAV